MKHLFTLLFTLASLIASAQFSNQTYQVQSNNIPQRTCGTGILPQQFENWVQSITSAQGNLKGGGNNSTQSIFNIPVIVHVVHDAEALNSVSATSGGNLNAAQIIDQINIMNRDYNGNNSDTSLIPAVFKPFLGKFQVNFCLAVVNPTGGILAEPGIDRINRVSKGWTAPPYTQAYCDATIKPNSIWDVNRYFNIWVLSLGNSLLGYATFPNPGTTGLLGLSAPFGGPTTDGVVILNTAFGSIGTAAGFAPYNKGRTVVHETGHWLGLRHIWGDATCGNDYCNDTPTQQTNNFGCPAYPKISCSNGPNGEMFMNYMDYTDDACMFMFSKDQKYRAQLIMTGSTIRANLLTSTVCNLPSVGNDIGLVYVASPTYSQVINCSNKITPVVNLQNFGSTTLTTAVIYYNCDGVNTQTVNWVGSLSPSTAVNYTLPQIVNLTNGSHAFNATVTAPNSGTDNNTSNNINNQSFSIANSFTMSANSPSICSSQNATLTASGGASTYTWNPGNMTGSSAVVSPTTTTIYTLSGTSGTCVNTFTTSVTVSASLVISANSATMCAGGSTILTASGATSYTWNTGPQTPTLSVSPAATTVYTVTGTNGSCNGSKTTTVTVNPNPTVAVNSTTICSGNNATLSASGATSYSWSTSASTSSIVVSPASTTVYTVTGTSGNCVNTKTAQVNVNATPTVSVSNSTVCAGNSATLTASGAVSYSWNTSATTASISVSPALTTIYTVTGTSGNCTNIKTSTVTVNPNPTVTVNSATICSGNSATLTASGATTYSWSNTSTLTSIAVNPIVTTVYTVSGYNGTCVNTKTTQVNVNPTPTVSVNNSTICSGNSTTLTASGASTYSWSSGPTSSSVSVNPVTTTVYSVTGTSGSCSNMKTSTVTVNITPTVNVNSFTICAGGSATLTASGATSYLWSNGPVTNTDVVSPTVTTVYSVTGTSNGCNNSKTATVTIGAGISIIMSPASQTICSGKSATITASGATSYTWSNLSNGNSIVVTPTANAVYSVTGVSGPCSGTNTAFVNITVPASVNMNVSNVTCFNSSTGAATINASGGASPYTYSYSTGPVTQTANGFPPGNYTATVTTAFGCVSTSNFTITQPAPINAIANSTNATCIACTNGTANVMVIGGTAPYTYTWLPSGGNASVALNLGAGCYTVNILDANNCSGSQTICVAEDNSGGVGLINHSIKSFTKVYPNPTSGHVTLTFANAELRTIQVYDVLGKVIVQTQTELATTDLDINYCANGVYFLRVSGPKESSVIRLVKQ
jgi:hypothetical protein